MRALLLRYRIFICLAFILSNTVVFWGQLNAQEKPVYEEVSVSSDLTSEFKYTDKEKYKPHTYQPLQIEKINPEIMSSLSEEERDSMIKKIQEYKNNGKFDLIHKEMIERLKYLDQQKNVSN